MGKAETTEHSPWKHERRESLCCSLVSEIGKGHAQGSTSDSVRSQRQSTTAAHKFPWGLVEHWQLLEEYLTLKCWKIFVSALSWLRGAISWSCVLRASFSLVTVTKETSQHFGVACAIVSERRSSVFHELGLKFALAGHLSCDSTFLVWPQSSNSMPGRY